MGGCMSAKSNYLEDKLIDHVLRNTPYTSPAGVYVALFTAVADGEAGTVTEVTGGSYVRRLVTFGAPSNGATSNSAEIVFPVATGNWNQIVSFGIYDALTNGNLLYYGTLTTAKTISVDDQFRFAVGALQVSEA